MWLTEFNGVVYIVVSHKISMFQVLNECNNIRLIIKKNDLNKIIKHT